MWSSGPDNLGCLSSAEDPHYKVPRRGVDETEKDVMALPMDHQKATANRYYDVSTGGNMSAQFRRIFQKFYYPLSLTDDECSDNDLNSESESQPDSGGN